MNVKEEILALTEIHEGCDWHELAGRLEQISKILSAHELVPIDDTPFDPSVFGFREVNGQCVKGDGEFFIENNLGCFELWRPGEDEPAIRVASWPIKHSTGVSLLKGLGLEVRE